MAKMSSFVLTMCSWIVADLFVIEHAFHVPILQPAEMRGRFEFVAMNFSFGQGMVVNSLRVVRIPEFQRKNALPNWACRFR